MQTWLLQYVFTLVDFLLAWGRMEVTEHEKSALGWKIAQILSTLTAYAGN